VRRHGWCILALVGLVLVLVLFGKGLFSPDLVLSDAGKDGDTYFYNKLLFDREWSSWNPYILQPADWMVRGIPLLKPGKHIIESG